MVLGITRIPVFMFALALLVFTVSAWGAYILIREGLARLLPADVSLDPQRSSGSISRS